MTLRPLLAGAALTASLALPSVAAAATTGYVTVDLNLRAGPSTAYPVVTTMYAGAPVTVYGCLSDWGWCDVSWEGWRGWASGTYLDILYQSEPVYLPTYAPRIGLPIITFEFATYWDRHYHGRPWYRERDRWYAYWRDRDDRRDELRDRLRDTRERYRDRLEDVREELREERREDRQEAREDRREDRRQETAQERRRDERQEARQERRQEQRQEARQERRQEQRQEARQERRQEQRQQVRQERREERREARQDRRRGGGENCVTRPNGRVVCQ